MLSQKAEGLISEIGDRLVKLAECIVDESKDEPDALMNWGIAIGLLQSKLRESMESAYRKREETSVDP